MQAYLLLRLQVPDHVVDEKDPIVAAARETWKASASQVTVSQLQVMSWQ